MSTQLLQDLEALQTSLETREFVFTDWARCACGHVAYVATGMVTKSSQQVISDHNERARAMTLALLDAAGVKDHLDEPGHALSHDVCWKGSKLVKKEGRHPITDEALNDARRRYTIELTKKAIRNTKAAGLSGLWIKAQEKMLA